MFFKNVGLFTSFVFPRGLGLKPKRPVDPFSALDKGIALSLVVLLAVLVASWYLYFVSGLGGFPIILFLALGIACSVWIFLRAFDPLEKATEKNKDKWARLL